MELVGKMAEKAREFYKKDKKSFFLVAAIAVIGIVLRLSFINATDISMDEAFFVTFAYKIAYILWANPLIAVALAAVAVVVLYLVAVKRNLWVAVGVVLLALIAKFGFGIPYLTPSTGPGLVLAIASTIFVTGLPPNVAGELVSSISMIGLAFVGLYLGSKWNKAVGIFAFSLLMLSPYNIFMSTTSFLGPLGWFFGFLSLALF